MFWASFVSTSPGSSWKSPMRASSVTVAVAKRGTGPIVADVGELDQWKHCPRCGAEVEPGGGMVECGACGFRVYASSKPTASAVCLDDDGRVLLSRRGIDPFAGKWDFPGGFLDEEEHPLDCVRRELREEAGVEIEPLELPRRLAGPLRRRRLGRGHAQLLLDGAHRRGHARARRRRRGAPLVRAGRDLATTTSRSRTRERC